MAAHLKLVRSDSISHANFKGFNKKRDDSTQGNLPEVQSLRWWELDAKTDDGADVANAIEAHIHFLQQHQMSRMRQLIISARLYGNATLTGITGFSADRIVATGSALKDRISDNVVQSVVDTQTAVIGQNKPRPYYLTDGGSYKLQRRAKKLNQFSEAIFHENKSYRLGGEAQRDAGIFGDGFVFVTIRNKRVVHERVLGSELWIDELEAMYGQPRQLHWVRAVDREELIHLFPEKEDVIRSAMRADFKEAGVPSTASDMVTVRESWHLRSSDDAKDGKHTVSISGHLLDPVTEWPYDFFPFARFRWGPRPLGYWSQGLAEQLQNKQLEVNKILWIIQRAIHLASGYKVLLEDGSKVVSEHINNDIGAIIKYRGTKPEWVVPAVVPMEYYQHYERLVESMYERAGLSLQVATGVKPQGLNSGEAQRVYRDTVTQRLRTNEEFNEDAYIDLSKISIAMAREVALKEGFYEARTPQGRVLKTIRMKADELDPSDWEAKCFPTSSLPKDPSGRLQTITELGQAGLISLRTEKKLLNFPDLEAVESLDTAAEELISKILDGICDDGEYEAPEPTFDLSLSKQMVVEYINRGMAQDLEDDRMDMLRAWNAQVDALMQMAQPPAPPQAPGATGMGPPQAQPMAPPTSQLIPNAPGMAQAA